MSAAFPCARCGASIPLPDPKLGEVAGLVCPSCGQRYKRRAGGSGATRAGMTVAGTPGPGPTPPPAARPTPPPSHATPSGARTPPPASGPVQPFVQPVTPPDRPRTTPSGGRSTPAGPRPTPPGALSRTQPLSLPAAAAAPPIFAPGDFVANRYRVVRFVARGGMGEVYEVEDLELRGRVALKTVASASVGEPGAVERFKREIHLARLVTHPNVCRIFDVGFHEPAPGEPPIVFLTMELLEGETLVARLRRGGKLSTATALPLARQLGAALAAAHEAGVVHRDFKSENVFLVPGRHDQGGERAVVTDFGIARAGGDESFGVTLTSDGGVIGTPAYMSPEQIEGRAITAAADQYALGVVLFEMVTGELPFRGENPLSTAARRLTEAPPPPTKFVPDLDPRWEAVILRCLARQPELRFPDVSAAIRGLEERPGGEVVAPTVPAPAAVEAAAVDVPTPSAAPALPRGARRQRALAALLLVGLAVAVAWSVWRVRALRSRVELGTPVAARRAVAVFGLRNLSGRAEAAWLSTAFAEMLGTELARSRELRVVPGDSVAKALVELELAGSDAMDGEARARLWRRLGADYLVLGTYTALPEGGALRLDLRLEDARSSETRASFGESGSEAQLFELVARAGEALRGALDAGGAEASTRRPSSPESARLYSEGLDALRRFDAQGASELLERAVAADPGNALARSALASAWTTLGYRTRAEQESRRARELAGDLPVEERTVVEARYFETTGEWASAAELWQKLWTAYPDTLAYGLRVASARAQAGQPEVALAAALALRNLPPPDGEDPRIDLAEATAAGALGDARRQAEAAGRAAERATAQGARLLAAEALVARAWALRNLGQSGEARAAGERARALYEQTGDRAGAAEADAALGGILLDAGDAAGARRTYERALATSRQLGDRGGEARALNNLAVLARGRGELESARADYERLAATAAEAGDRIGGAFAANNLAAVLADLGEFEEAATRAQAALEVWRASGEKGGMAAALANLGAVRRRQGDLGGAERAWQESLALRRETGQRPGEAAALNGLAQTLLERGDLAAAGERFGEAARIAREISSRSALAGARLGQAEVAAVRADWGAAEAGFTEALAIRREIGERAGEAPGPARPGEARARARAGRRRGDRARPARRGVRRALPRARGGGARGAGAGAAARRPGGRGPGGDRAGLRPGSAPAARDRARGAPRRGAGRAGGGRRRAGGALGARAAARRGDRVGSARRRARGRPSPRAELAGGAGAPELAARARAAGYEAIARRAETLSHRGRRRSRA